MPNRIVPIPTAEGILPAVAFTSLMNFSKYVRVIFYAWYIEGPGKHILVDAGFNSETMRSHSKLASGEEFQGGKDYNIEEELQRIGITGKDIDTVVVTHGHADHINHVGMFPKAKILVQKAEMERMGNYPPAQPFALAYGDRRLLSNPQVEVVQGDYDLADGVKALFTPGHTAGTQSVQVETPAGKISIAGMCAMNENFAPPETAVRLDVEGNPYKYEVLHIGIFEDAIASYNSMLRLKHSSDMVIGVHDPSWAERKTIP